MNKPLPTGSVIGILGGGQLGRMLSVAASRLGFISHIFEPSTGAPAGHVAAHLTQAPYTDTAALTRFAESVDVITYEFENIPTAVFATIGSHCPVRPAIRALSTSQNRMSEKRFMEKLGLSVAPYCEVTDEASLRDALDKIGTPSILKTQQFGYDGKGQIRIQPGDDPSEIWLQMNDAPCVLEGFIAFEREISVIGARGLDGRVACFDPGENVHRGGILHTTTLPAQISTKQLTDAVLLTGKILNSLEYVGVMGVELFVTRAGLIVNEIAPRVHNSGHWTQDGCAIDQFEQHIRAIAGWPLGDGARQHDVVMENLIGPDMDRVPQLASDPTVSLHLYGKQDVKPGRKMGHFNRVRGAVNS